MEAIKNTCSAFIQSASGGGVYLQDKDLSEKRIESKYLQNIEYRYAEEDTDDEKFQILVNGNWLNAQSMDFYFND